MRDPRPDARATARAVPPAKGAGSAVRRPLPITDEQRAAILRMHPCLAGLLEEYA